MRRSPFNSIREHLINHANPGRFLWGTAAQVHLSDVLTGTYSDGRAPDLCGKSVLLATQDQAAAALALIELDGIARRIIVCPPDLAAAHFPAVIARGEADAIVSDYDVPFAHDLLRVSSVAGIAGGAAGQDRPLQRTEWVLLTSGTTGAPKMIVHTLASLTAPIDANQEPGRVWGTFYDIRRYGGLQIFLRALLGGGSLVLSSAGEPVSDHLGRLAARGVTHLSGTPSQWRRVLMSPAARLISPAYIRLSGEIADQSILDALRSFYPDSRIGHAFASTEAGVAFEVNDGLTGFPASFIGSRGEVEIGIRHGSLIIRSGRAASHYLDAESGPLKDQEGFVDTGDIVDVRGERCYFLGRRNGVINVGGLKVYPEEVEAVINRHPAVRMCMVVGRKNTLMGALVAADVVVTDAAVGVPNEILAICRQSLPVHKVPATIRCVTALEIASAGKMVRHYA
ncbi:MAG: long-chain fatty acid--CoA ligase [Bryobacterales bacterium]|nr:long-chain fatty acid--CoA ligase [Bryobacterales bacterium]